MLDQIEHSKPIACGHDEIELHTLTCSADLDACLWAVKSFLVHSGRSTPVIVHSDGSIREREAERLGRHLPGCEIIDRARAKEEVAEFLRPYPSLFHYRCTLDRLMFFKLVDFNFYSRTGRVLAIDSDILWLKEPVQLNGFLDTGRGFFSDDYQNAYGFDVDALKRYYGIRMLPRVNAGLLHVPGRDAISWDLLDYAASLGIKHAGDRKFGRGGWFEQTLYAILFSVEQERYERLDGEQYVIPARKPTGDEDVTAVHCVTPRRPAFRVFAERAMERNGFPGLF
ncbi:MAG TPA: hypothetical protein VNP72_10795 [Longimicrobium sp.]|nr:hypothetical protein [Longimicrobium sp.]